MIIHVTQRTHMCCQPLSLQRHEWPTLTASIVSEQLHTSAEERV